MHPVLWFIFVYYKLHIITHKHIGWLVELSEDEEEEHNTERKLWPSRQQQNGLMCAWFKEHLAKIVIKMVKVAQRQRRDRGAAERTPATAPRSPLCVFTFFLSHAFFLPGATKQHQPHPPTDAELRERASRLSLTDKRRVRAAAAQPARRSSRFLRHVFCGASFKTASDQWGGGTAGRKSKDSQSATGGGARI